MKREEILGRLKTYVPAIKKKRVIISSDVKNEADDQFALICRESGNVAGNLLKYNQDFDNP